MGGVGNPVEAYGICKRPTVPVPPVTELSQTKFPLLGVLQPWRVVPPPPPVGIGTQLGMAALPELFPSMVLAGAWEKVKESAGVVLAVATLVVKSGERLPEEKLVTVPDPPPPPVPQAPPMIELPLICRQLPVAIPTFESVTPVGPKCSELTEKLPEEKLRSPPGIKKLGTLELTVLLPKSVSPGAIGGSAPEATSPQVPLRQL